MGRCSAWGLGHLGLRTKVNGRGNEIPSTYVCLPLAGSFLVGSEERQISNLSIDGEEHPDQSNPETFEPPARRELLPNSVMMRQVDALPHDVELA